MHKSGNLYYPHDLYSFTYLKCFEAIVIEDICQSIHILEEKEVISSYFRASTCDVSISPSTCIINIRGGDYLGFVSLLQFLANITLALYKNEAY